tara:strand:- start:23013 stop:23888 length:876 start_codon:yes stop_codon:yes gene_type:complete
MDSVQPYKEIKPFIKEACEASDGPKLNSAITRLVSKLESAPLDPKGFGKLIHYTHKYKSEASFLVEGFIYKHAGNAVSRLLLTQCTQKPEKELPKYIQDLAATELGVTQYQSASPRELDPGLDKIEQPLLLKGNSYSHIRMALLHLKGIRPNLTTALQLLKQPDTKELPETQVILGDLYCEESRKKEDISQKAKFLHQALKHYRQAQRGKHPGIEISLLKIAKTFQDLALTKLEALTYLYLTEHGHKQAFIELNRILIKSEDALEQSFKDKVVPHFELHIKTHKIKLDKLQ